MKIITDRNKGMKIVTDILEMNALYLQPSFAFDAVNGSINGSFRISKKDYEGSELKNAIDLALDASLDKAKKDNQKVADKIVVVQKAIEDDNDSDYLIFKFKNKAKIQTKSGELIDRKLKVVDSQGNEVVDYESLTGGTKGRLSLNVIPYYMPSRREAGITFWINGIQVTEANFYEGGSDFDTVDDGYVAGVSNTSEAVDEEEMKKNRELMDSFNILD